MWILNYKIDRNGIVRNWKTGAIITMLADPRSRQRRRYFLKVLRRELKNWAKAASQATGGTWNHTNQNPG